MRVRKSREKPLPQNIYCQPASLQEDLDEVAQLRYRCFGEELGLLPSTGSPVGREFGPLDTLCTTLHFLSRSGSQSTGTARLLLRNPEVARQNGTHLGLALEALYGVLGEPGLHHQAAEISRLCIPKQWQGSATLLTLFDALRDASKSWGVNYWLGATNLETDSLEDATIAYGVARHLGLLSKDWRLEPRERPVPTSSPPPSLYPLQQRLLVLRGEFAGLKLPKTLSLLIRMVNARIAGEPALDPYMRRYSIPIVVDLDDIPPHTTALLERLRRRQGTRSTRHARQRRPSPSLAAANE